MSAARPVPRLLLFGLPAIAVAALAFVAMPAAAHEHVSVDPYEFVVGWTAEPAVVGSPNGLELRVVWHGPANATEPVAGVQDNLTATLYSGGQSVVKALEPLFGEPGSYTFDVIPSREGTYSLGLVGAINGTAINITVDMDAPEARSDLEFPAVDPTNEELAQRLADAESALAAANANNTLLAGRVTAAESAASAATAAAAQSSPSTATMIGLVGLMLGAVGSGLGTLAWRATKARK